MGTMNANTLREQLRTTQAAVSEARNEQAARRAAFEAARGDFAKANVAPDKLANSPAYRRAQDAKAEFDAATEKLEAVVQAENGILSLIGGSPVSSDGNGPTAGDPSGGWAGVARELDIPNGRNRVNTTVADLMAGRSAVAGVTVSPGSGLTQPSMAGSFVQEAQDQRHIWDVFQREVVDSQTLAITDFRQTGSRTVSGSVERDPVATSSKATLSLAVTLENPALKQLAVVVDDVPSKLIEAIDAFYPFLVNEAGYQVSLALDHHCLSQLTAAAPPVGKEGTHLWEQVRNGVKAMRALGGQPTVLALDPDDAASLDMLTAGADALPVFALRDVGSASPLWGLTIREVPGLTAPTLIDPALVGVLYTGQATVLVDPLSKLDTNEVRLRVEMEVLLHIRDIIGGAYRIAEGE